MVQVVTFIGPNKTVIGIQILNVPAILRTEQLSPI